MLEVVFVEDEADLCELYEERFSSPNVNVKCFVDVSQAAKYIETHNVSVVFIDYRMPEVNGIEFRKRLSSELTCYLLTGEFLKEKVVGFVDVLEKPLKQEVFDAILNKHKSSQEEVGKNADPYRALFDVILQEVHIWKVVRDSKGKIKTWKLVNANQTALDVWGKRIEEVVGKTTEEIFPQANAVEKFMPIVERIFQTGEPCTWREYFKGTNQILEMTSVPCGDYFVSTGGTAHDEKD